MFVVQLISITYPMVAVIALAKKDTRGATMCVHEDAIQMIETTKHPVNIHVLNDVLLIFTGASVSAGKTVVTVKSW